MFHFAFSEVRSGLVGLRGLFWTIRSTPPRRPVAMAVVTVMVTCWLPILKLIPLILLIHCLRGKKGSGLLKWDNFGLNMPLDSLTRFNALNPLMRKSLGQSYFESLHGWETLDGETREQWETAAKRDAFNVVDSWGDIVKSHIIGFYEKEITADYVEFTAANFCLRVGLEGNHSSRLVGRWLSSLVEQKLALVKLRNGCSIYCLNRKDFTK